ncbi:MAG: 7-cyano-7-deazaguanine synthase QueC [Desulfobacteraceae bacterium]|nr:MAG: 7-cyano-7-deazaguanine synthase QueC [Desulfobacteraceae bacterium]
MENHPKKAIVLTSGGLDSTTVLAIARSENFQCYSLSFFYDQRHEVELMAAKNIAKTFGVQKHLVLNLDLGRIGGSALTSEMAVPKNRDMEQMAHGIPATYVPARNTIFLSHALAWAEVLGASDIFIGVNAVDYSGYPDCRPEYLSAFEKMANLALKSAVEGRSSIRIQTPLLYLSKAEIIRKGLELGVDYTITHSCYDPDFKGRACGFCDSCLLRKKGFEEAGVPDPTVYTTD